MKTHNIPQNIPGAAVSALVSQPGEAAAVLFASSFKTASVKKDLEPNGSNNLVSISVKCVLVELL